MAVMVALLAACGGQDETGHGDGASASLVLEEAWVRPMLEGARMTAAYGRLRNTGDSAVTLGEWSAAGFESVSLHETTLEGGMSRMRAVVDQVIQPGEELILQPNGYHLMLMAPESLVGVGDTVELTLTLPSGQALAFTAAVGQ